MQLYFLMKTIIAVALATAVIITTSVVSALASPAPFAQQWSRRCSPGECTVRYVLNPPSSSIYILKVMPLDRRTARPAGGVVEKVDAKSGALLWKTQLKSAANPGDNACYLSPSTASGRFKMFYVEQQQQYQQDDVILLQCLVSFIGINASNGALLYTKQWQHDADTSMRLGLVAPLRHFNSAAALITGVKLAPSYQFHLAAFRVSDGAQLWLTANGTTDYIQMEFDFVSQSVVLLDNYPGSMMRAYSASTGSLSWKLLAPGASSFANFALSATAQLLVFPTDTSQATVGFYSVATGIKQAELPMRRSATFLQKMILKRGSGGGGGSAADSVILLGVTGVGAVQLPHPSGGGGGGAFQPKFSWYSAFNPMVFQFSNAHLIGSNNNNNANAKYMFADDGVGNITVFCVDETNGCGGARRGAGQIGRLNWFCSHDQHSVTKCDFPSKENAVARPLSVGAMTAGRSGKGSNNHIAYTTARVPSPGTETDDIVPVAVDLSLMKTLAQGGVAPFSAAGTSVVAAGGGASSSSILIYYNENIVAGLTSPV